MQEYTEEQEYVEEHTDDNILYPPFTIDKCKAFAEYADSVNKRIEQHENNRYALAYNEIVVDGEIVVDEHYEEKQLSQAKEDKYNEANKGAKDYIENEAAYEFEEGKHIEATDGNIGKFTAYALAYVTGQLEPTDVVVWNTKEDETVELNQEQVGVILNGLGQVQTEVWAVKFPYYVGLIEQAETIEEVEAIIIDYSINNETEE